MQYSELFDLLMADANHPFTGWDFSHISATGRMAEAPLTWSYVSKLLVRLRKALALLDMGIGGGEFLSSLQPLPPYTCATEGYAPNVPVARQRLEYPHPLNSSVLFNAARLPLSHSYAILSLSQNVVQPEHSRGQSYARSSLSR
jgi:hypothetical protein